MNKAALITLISISVAAAVALTVFFAIATGNKLHDNFKKARTTLDSIKEAAVVESYTFPPEIKVKMDSLISETDSLTAYISGYRSHMKRQAENSGSIKKDKTEIWGPSQLLGRLKTHKDFLIRNFPDNLDEIEKSIVTGDRVENGKIISWEDYYFKNMPLAATITILSQWNEQIEDLSDDIQMMNAVY